MGAVVLSSNGSSRQQSRRSEPRKRFLKADMHQHCKADDLGQRVKVAKRAWRLGSAFSAHRRRTAAAKFQWQVSLAIPQPANVSVTKPVQSVFTLSIISILTTSLSWRQHAEHRKKCNWSGWSRWCADTLVDCCVPAVWPTHCLHMTT